MLNLYLDEAIDRQHVAFTDAVEAVRSGWIYAHDDKQHKAWVGRRHQPVQSTALTGMALEQHIAALHRSRPDIVALRASA